MLSGSGAEEEQEAGVAWEAVNSTLLLLPGILEI